MKNKKQAMAMWRSAANAVNEVVMDRDLGYGWYWAVPLERMRRYAEKMMRGTR